VERPEETNELLMRFFTRAERAAVRPSDARAAKAA
jgi:hypothetical protein